MLRWLKNSIKLLKSNDVSCLLVGEYSFIRLFNSKVLSICYEAFHFSPRHWARHNAHSRRSLWSVVPWPPRLARTRQKNIVWAQGWVRQQRRESTGWENPFEFLQRSALVPVLQLGSIHLVIVRHNCVLSGLHNTPISSIVRPCHYFIHPVP